MTTYTILLHCIEGDIELLERNVPQSELAIKMKAYQDDTDGRVTFTESEYEDDFLAAFIFD